MDNNETLPTAPAMRKREKVPQYEYADDPEYFRLYIDTVGYDKAVEELGYKKNSLMQMYDGRAKVRQLIEFACQQYIENKEKKTSSETIFFFSARDGSDKLAAIKTVAQALGVTIQKL